MTTGHTGRPFRTSCGTTHTGSPAGRPCRSLHRCCGARFSRFRPALRSPPCVSQPCFLSLTTLLLLLLLVRGTDRGNKLLLALGMCLGVLATLLRQTGMLIPVAFGIGYLSRGRAGTRRALFAVGFFLLTIAAFVVYSG